MPKPDQNQPPGRRDRRAPSSNEAAAETEETRAQREPLPGSGGRLGAGAPPSNTAPASYTAGLGEIVTPLRQGVDSLYLSYSGQLATAWRQRLDGLKLAARSQDPQEIGRAQVRIGDHLFEVSDRGKGKFAYVLADNCFHISLPGGEASALPLAYAQISSECLTALGVTAAEQRLGYIVRTLGAVEGSANISRADVFVDFISRHPVERWSWRSWVTRAHKINAHHVRGHFSGWSIGLGGVVAARLYDKTLELERSRKDYLKPLWEAAGWRDGQTVWRLEFEFKRDALKELGVCQIEDLLPNLGPLWRYGTQTWLRLTLPTDTDENQSRWPTHPLWELLSTLPWPDSLPGTLSRLRQDRAPSDEALFVNGLGGITSFMAREGITDLDEGLGEYLHQLQRFHDQRGRASGEDLAGYVRKKVALKGRRFNTLAQPDPDADQRREAEAMAYRTSRDGDQ